MKSAGALATSAIGRDPAPTGPSSTGLQAGNRGFAVSPMSGVMDAGSVLQTDRNLAASLPPQIASWLGPDGRTDALETRWETYGEPAREVLEAAYSTSLGAMQPASEAQLTKALATLRAVTKERARADEDLDLANAAMVRELREFPADAALSAIRHLARESTFFPSLADLIEACHRRSMHRRHLHRLLERKMG